MLDNLWYGIKVLGSISLWLVLIIIIMILAGCIISLVRNLFKGD